MDDKTPTMPTHTTTMAKQLNKPVGELRLGADDDALTLATQENPPKKLVYITNMPECTLETSENVQDSSKNTNEEDDRKPSPVEKTDQITSIVQLNAYKESDREDDSKKAREAQKNIWRTRKIIHMEFDSDDDVDEQTKNSSNVKMEGKVRVKKQITHYYEFSSDKEEGKCADPKKVQKTQEGHENQVKNDENDQALVSNEMTLSSIGKDIFIGDSAATSHMTNNRTGVYDLVPIRGSVIIGNGESISCTHKGKLDVICKHRDGSTARQTWEVKIVPQLNHDLFSFTKAMKEGWLMNGRWKEGGLMIELFKQAKTSMKFDTLATQENPPKKLVYITNMPECTLETSENVRDSSKNTNEEDDRKPSPVEKTDQITSIVQLNAYKESDREDDSKKAREAKNNIWRTRKIIHMEFDSDDDVDEQTKNSSNVKTEGKVRVKKQITHYYEFSSDKEEGKCADPKKVQKTQEGHENQVKNDENDQALVSNEMTLSSIGKDIFIGDSAATSHMTNNRTGVYDLVPIRGSVIIGNGESISCTHKGKLDVICKHRDGSTARQTWEVKIVPQLNHDLFSFTKAMKEGWMMNGRWKEGCYFTDRLRVYRRVKYGLFLVLK